MHPIRSPWTKAVLKYHKNIGKHAYTWELSNALLNDDLVKEEIKKEIKGFLEFNDNQDTSYQNLWDTMKAVVRGKLTALIASKKKLKRAYLCWQLNSTPESSRTKRSKSTQEG